MTQSERKIVEMLRAVLAMPEGLARRELEFVIEQLESGDYVRPRPPARSRRRTAKVTAGPEELIARSHLPHVTHTSGDETDNQTGPVGRRRDTLRVLPGGLAPG